MLIDYKKSIVFNGKEYIIDILQDEAMFHDVARQMENLGTVAADESKRQTIITAIYDIMVASLGRDAVIECIGDKVHMLNTPNLYKLVQPVLLEQIELFTKNTNEVVLNINNK